MSIFFLDSVLNIFIDSLTSYPRAASLSTGSQKFNKYMFCVKTRPSVRGALRWSFDISHERARAPANCSSGVED